MAKRMHAKLKELNELLRRRMHDSIAETGKWLGAVVRGHFRYYGVPLNYPALDRFHDRVRRLWRRALMRLGQKGYISEARMTRIAANLSALSRGPSCRHDPRQEPGAVVPLAGICAGGGGQPPSLPRLQLF